MTETLSDPRILAAADAAYWAVFNQIRLQAGVFTLNKREFQLEPMQSTARRRCYMKGTQQGVTEFETVLRSLHGLIHKLYPKGVLVLFPTADNVQDFSKSRFNPIISSNRQSIGRFIKSGLRGGTDTASLKRVFDAFLYLRGARLPQGIGIGGDAKESVQLSSAPVDCVKFEELDLIDESAIMKGLMRMGDSDVGEEVYISNPTLPDYGIDKLFQKSDQRHRFKRCGCGTWSCPELTFPECVKLRLNGRGYVGCSKCGKDIGPHSGVKGKWVPAVRDNSDYMEGWRMSQLMSAAVINDPAEILRDYNDPPQGNLSDVYRLRLGLPHVAAEDRLTGGRVLECCGSNGMLESHNGPCAMGVDVGKTKHIVIGPRISNERYEFVKIIRVTSWNDIHDLIKRYNVTSAVIDARPYEDEARAFQKAEAENCRIFLCEYSENTVLRSKYNEAEGIVKVNRTEIFDTSHRVVAGLKLVLPRRQPEVDEFVKQCCNSAKVLETNKKTGNVIYRYRTIGSGGDHYRNALNYYLLAAVDTKLSVSSNGRVEQTKAITEYQLI